MQCSNTALMQVLKIAAMAWHRVLFDCQEVWIFGAKAGPPPVFLPYYQEAALGGLSIEIGALPAANDGPTNLEISTFCGDDRHCR